MKKIFLDTNFIIDYFVREDYNGDAETLLQLGDRLNFKFFISYLSVANFAYIMRKLPASQLNDIIYKICNIFHVVDNTRSQILKNLESGFKDLKMACNINVQYQCAVDSDCDCIITRNKNDFINSTLPVMIAAEYITNAPYNQ
ncbi:MAG: PIN domain-containing protein [Muribaculaceae bacterium]|nr:PIN domain-containing protein [Muribaculaceae bacterium]